MNVLKRNEVMDFVKGLKDKIFSVVFIKRTTGEIREMTCRQGVTKYLAGGKRSYEFEDRLLLPIFDMTKKDYRCIPIEGIKGIKVNGITHIVV